MLKLNNIVYTITSKEVEIVRVSSGYMVSVNVIGKNTNIDPEIREISLAFGEVVERQPGIANDVKGLLFVAEFNDVTGTLELGDDNYIHFYGKANVNWNDELGQDVEIDLELGGNLNG